jgi:putative pyruvate formate lyase activating enzyme
MFDIWLADFKFGNDVCALRLAKTPDYMRIVRENLLWANAHGELIVRHLLMPGPVECCWRPVAEWLSVSLPGVKVSLRDGFWPAWQARRHTEFQRAFSEVENAAAWRIAGENHLQLAM